MYFFIGQFLWINKFTSSLMQDFKMAANFSQLPMYCYRAVVLKPFVSVPVPPVQIYFININMYSNILSICAVFPLL